MKEIINKHQCDQENFLNKNFECHSSLFLLKAVFVAKLLMYFFFI